MPLLLVRHAQAKPRKEWDGEDRVRPLSPHGFRQADGLIAIMGVERTDDLREGQSSVAVSLVRALAGEEAVVCTHGDVIAEILVALADEDRLDLGQNPRQAKGSVWALDGRAGSFTSAKYFAPVVVDTV